MKNLKKLLLLTAPLLALASENNLVVHEWGTFTSFMGSDGKVQSGLHHEDEPLPNFVYGVKNVQEGDFIKNRNNNCPVLSKLGPMCDTHSFAGNNLFQTLPQNPITEGVTQKMETPVVYFYGDVGQKVKVEIDFPTGIISQYYPKATSYSPKYKDVTTLGPSNFVFDVELKEKDFVGNTPFTLSDSIWNPAREVDANTIEVGNEHEKFIFYRGVADFTPTLQVTSKGNTITANITKNETIKHIFLLNNDGKFGYIQSISPNKVTTVREINAKTDLDFHSYVNVAKAMISKSLITEGLYTDESLAMVNTWEESYFHTPGLRVLYVLDNKETERLLPMKVTPAPKELTRVIVGRLEIMTEAQEDDYLELLRGRKTFEINKEELFGRFYEPKLRRLLEKAKNENVKESKKIINRINFLL